MAAAGQAADRHLWPAAGASVWPSYTLPEHSRTRAREQHARCPQPCHDATTQPALRLGTVSLQELAQLAQTPDLRLVVCRLVVEVPAPVTFDPMSDSLHVAQQWAISAAAKLDLTCPCIELVLPNLEGVMMMAMIMRQGRRNGRGRSRGQTRTRARHRVQRLRVRCMQPSPTSQPWVLAATSTSGTQNQFMVAQGWTWESRQFQCWGLPLAAAWSSWA